jgi:hypothetical protein
MITLSSHTARALADERVRELTERHIGERQGYGAPVQPALVQTTRKRTPAVRARPRSDTSFALAAAVRHLRRRVDPHRS